MERRLVDDRATHDRRPVGLIDEFKALEPGLPAGPEVARDANLVLLIRRPSGTRNPVCALSVVVVCGHSSTVRTRLVSPHHIIW